MCSMYSVHVFCANRNRDLRNSQNADKTYPGYHTIEKIMGGSSSKKTKLHRSSDKKVQVLLDMAREEAAKGE